MAEANHPIDKVRHLQRQLYLAAKRSPRRRFHALYDRIARRDVLERAWDQVRANRGAAGIDGETISEVETYGVARMLDELQDQLEVHRYRATPVRRVYLLKADGKTRRPLGIPRVRDRVVQAAARLVLEPIFEASFKAVERHSGSGSGSSSPPLRAGPRLDVAMRVVATRGNPGTVRAGCQRAGLSQ